MLWTKLTEKALNTAATLHDKQYRKGQTDLPYVIHLVAVANIVSGHTDDEEVVAAALLHDTLEDTPYTTAELERDFGTRVKDIVLGVTIPKKLIAKGERGVSYDERGYLENLTAAPTESAIIAAGDKIHNFEQSVDLYEGRPEDFKKDFKFTFEQRIKYYEPIVKLVVARVPEALGKELSRVWERHVAFIRALEQAHVYEAK